MLFVITMLSMMDVCDIDDPLWENCDYGIRADSEFTQYDDRSLPEQGADYMSAVWCGLKYSVSALVKRLSPKRVQNFDDPSDIGKAGSRGLIIMFHGLNGEPSVWDAHLDALGKIPDIDVYAPNVPNAGVCSLHDDKFKVLIARILKWIDDNQGRPIGLLGQSNGSRIALHLEYLLRSAAPRTPIYLSTTGGVMFGSKTVEMTGLNLLYPLLSSNYNIYGDLCFGSQSAKELLTRAREPLFGCARREYHLYASYHDHHVWSLGSSLPILNPTNDTDKTERHYIMFDHGHNAAPWGAVDKQIEGFMKFVDRYTQ